MGSYWLRRQINPAQGLEGRVRQIKRKLRGVGEGTPGRESSMHKANRAYITCFKETKRSSLIWTIYIKRNTKKAKFYQVLKSFVYYFINFISLCNKQSSVPFSFSIRLLQLHNLLLKTLNLF